jgi:predicted transcriptional regulator of viral defense system
MRRDPAELRRALHRLVAPRGGYFTAAQALELGYSYQSQRYHAERGNWDRVERGIYRVTGWPEPDHPELVRWDLRTGGRAVASHETALAVHDLGDVMPGRVHVTVPPGFRGSGAGAVLHRAELSEGDVEQGAGFSLTTPVRSILDSAAAGIEVDQLALVIREALDRGLITERTLRARADEFGDRAALAVERALRREGR